MKPVSFKELKLFKAKDSRPNKSKNNKSKKKVKKEGIDSTKTIQNPFLYLFIFVIILAYTLAYVPSRSLPVPEKGEIATSDIVAPADLTIRDEETTESRKNTAAEAVPPVYSFNANVFPNTEERIREFFIAGRDFLKKPLNAQSKKDFQNQVFENYGLEISSENLNALISNKFAPANEENLINLIGIISQNYIITSKNLFLRGEQQKGLTVITQDGTESLLNISDILDLKEAKQKITEEVGKLDIPQGEKNLLTNLSHLFLSQNIFYDQFQTELRQERARANTGDAFYTIKKGLVLLRKGDEVTDDALKKITAVNQNLRAIPSWWINFVGTFLLFGLLFFTFFPPGEFEFPDRLCFLPIGLIKYTVNHNLFRCPFHTIFGELRQYHCGKTHQ